MCILFLVKWKMLFLGADPCPGPPFPPLHWHLLKLSDSCPMRLFIVNDSPRSQWFICVRSIVNYKIYFFFPLYLQKAEILWSQIKSGLKKYVHWQANRNLTAWAWGMRFYDVFLYLWICGSKAGKSRGKRPTWGKYRFFLKSCSSLFCISWLKSLSS